MRPFALAETLSFGKSLLPMKPFYLIPPLIALTASVAYLGFQQNRIKDLEVKMRVLSERVTLYEAIPEAERVGLDGGQGEDPLMTFFLENGDFDWAALGNELEKQRRGEMPTNIRAFFEVQKKLLEMSGPEIEEALDDIAKLDLSKAIRGQLESSLLSIFGEKDPARALAYFEGLLSDPGGMNGWHLTRAFERWLEVDQAAAAAWFKSRSRAGKFETKALDPTKSLKARFESRLLGHLMREDLEGARTWLDKLTPVEQRRVIMSASLEGGLSEGHLELIREIFTEEEERYGVLAEAFGQQSYREGLPNFAEQISGVALEPAEKEAITVKVVQNFARPWERNAGELAQVYSWAAREVPGREGELTGVAFAHFGGHRNRDFSETLREVMKVAEETEDNSIIEFFARELEDPDRHFEELKDADLRARFIDMIGEPKLGPDQ